MWNHRRSVGVVLGAARVHKTAPVPFPQSREVEIATPDEVIRSHRIGINAVLAGSYWRCICGKQGRPMAEDEARLDGERHVSEQLELQPSEGRQSDSQALSLLLRIHESGRRVDATDLTTSSSYSDVMAGLEDLQSRGWIDIGKANYGDNRLWSAHDVTVSWRGEQVIEEAMAKGVDLTDDADLGETDDTTLQASIPDVAGKRHSRGLFMDRLYDETQGATSKVVDPRPLGRSLGWTPQLTADVVTFLHDEGLLTRPGWGAVSIAHPGVVEVEQLREAPEQKTEHFNPINFIHVGDNNTGSIQVGTSNSAQVNVIASTDAVLTFLRELRSALDSAELPDATRDMALAQVEAVQQGVIEADGPESSIAKRLLPSLKDIGLGIVGNGAYDALAAAIANLPF